MEDTRKQLSISRSGFLVTLYIVVAAVAFVVVSTGYYALEQRVPKDYSYYAQFAEKIFSSTLPHSFAPVTGLCMHGRNIFFMDGCDGAADMSRGLHFEPPKYALALVYEVFHSPLALFVFYILLFYSPLLYAALIVRKREQRIASVHDPRLLVTSVVAYALYPASFVLVGDALRPMILFFPFFLLFMLSLIYRRSTLEQFLFLNLLLLVREEGIILAFIGVAYTFVREAYEGKKHTLSSWLALNAALWTIPVYVYMRWVGSDYTYVVGSLGGTTQKIFSFLATHVTLVVSIAVLLVVAGGYALYRRTYLPLVKWLALTPAGRASCIVLVPLAVVALLLIMGWTSLPWTPQFIYWRMGMFTALFAITGVLVFMETFGAHERERLFWRRAMLFFIAMCIAGQYFPGSALRQYLQDRNEINDVELVFAASHVITQNDVVVADPQTAMVLTGDSGLIIYNGLPTSPQSSFPTSLFRSTKGGNTYLLVSTESTPDLFSLAHEAGRTLTVLQKNSAYGFYEVK